MASLRAGLCWFAALLLGLLAGCFTGPINRLPQVASIQPSAPVMRGHDASFTVIVSDPDDDPLDVKWGVVPDDCPADRTVEHWMGDLQSLPAGEQQVMVGGDVTRDARFCLCAFASDSHHAVASNCLQVAPMNLAPVTKLRVESPSAALIYPLYSHFQLSGEGSVDPEGDALTRDWSITGPSGATVVPEACASSNPLEACFFADTPGEYLVTLTTSDTLQVTSPASLTLKVAADRLPCLGMTMPGLSSLSITSSDIEETKFTVESVDDDGNAFGVPPVVGRIQFTWYLGSGTGPLVYKGNDFNVFTIVPGTFRSGDTARVRVEIRDDANRDAIDNILLGCGNQRDLCESPPGSGCFLGATWTVSFAR
jgi:hypothetical protein